MADLDHAKLRQASAAIDRMAGESPQPRRTIGMRLAAWRQRRRIAKLDRSLGEGTLVVAEHSSSALLAVVTERIARIGKSHATSEEIAATIRLIEAIRDDYLRHVDRLAAERDAARTQVIEWRRKYEVAIEADRPDLAADVVAVIDTLQRREGEATSALASCDASRARLDDAIAEVRALERRSQA
jgi:phage shock protein A